MRHAVQVPRQLVARLHAGVALAGDGGKLLNLCDCCVYPLTERRQRRDVRAVYRSLPLPEQPWIAEAAAAYHRKLTAGVAQDMRRVLGREDIAVCNDRDAHGLAHLADNVPVRAPGVHLRARPAVYGDSGCAAVLAHARKVHGVDAAVVPALAELHRDGAARALYDAPDYFLCKLRCAHERGAVA